MQKIIVENFGPIKYAEIELRDFVVLIGEQASGKSTIAKLVYFFKTLERGYISSFFDALSKGQVFDMKALFMPSIQARFVNYYGSPAFLPAFSLKFYYSFENDKWLKIYLTKSEEGSRSTFSIDISEAMLKSEQEERINLRDTIPNIPSDDIFYSTNLPEEVKRKRFESFFKLIDQTSQKIFDVSSDSYYIPASRNITTNFPDSFLQSFYGSISNATAFNKADMIIMKAFMDRVAFIKEEFKTHNGFEKMAENYKLLHKEVNQNSVSIFVRKAEAILKARYVNESGVENLYFDSNKFVFLENSSTGQQESIRILQDLYLSLLNYDSVFRIIEEPEAHLFPNAQKNLIELFAIVINSTKSQILITTHSPYVLSVLANLLYANKVKTLGAASGKEIEEKTEMNELTWLDKEKFAAYTMKDGIAVSIFDREDSGMINQNYLDEVSEYLGREFQVLYNLRAKQIKESRKND